TLLEMLVALTVLGFLMVGLNEGVRTGLGMWSRQARQIGRSADRQYRGIGFDRPHLTQPDRRHSAGSGCTAGSGRPIACHIVLGHGGPPRFRGRHADRAWNHAPRRYHSGTAGRAAGSAVDSTLSRADSHTSAPQRNRTAARCRSHRICLLGNAGSGLAGDLACTMERFGNAAADPDPRELSGGRPPSLAGYDRRAAARLARGKTSTGLKASRPERM